MKAGDRVELKMLNTLCAGVAMDDNSYSCELLRYDESKECLYLLMNSARLETLSLDAIYDCKIRTDMEVVQCTGRIKERYCQAAGKILKMHVKNGFYKISLKSVDKQMA